MIKPINGEIVTQCCQVYDSDSRSRFECMRKALELYRGYVIKEVSWQPIETAPKDGTWILVYSPVDGINTSHFEFGLWQGLPWRGNQEDRDKAALTHWMPLPAPPL